MIPLNTAERKSSFALFITFFVVSVLLIIGTVFYGLQVPLKQNELMKKQIEAFQKDQAFFQTFAAKVSDTWIILDKINKPNVDTSMYQAQISGNISTLNRLMGTDSTAHPAAFNHVILALAALQAAKEQLRDRSNNNASESVLQQKLDKANQDLQTANGQLIQCQTSNTLLQNSLNNKK